MLILSSSASSRRPSQLLVLAEDKIFEVHADMPYYSTLSSVVPGRRRKPSSRAGVDDHSCTATGLIRTATQWTKRLRQTIENHLNKRNSRTRKDRLEHAQA